MTVIPSYVITRAMDAAAVGSTGVGLVAGVPSRSPGVDGKRCSILPLEIGWSGAASFTGAQLTRSFAASIGDRFGIHRPENPAVNSLSVPNVQQLASTDPLKTRTGTYSNSRHELTGSSRQIRSRTQVKPTSNSIDETGEQTFQCGVFERGDEIVPGIGRRNFTVGCILGFLASNILGNDADVHAAEPPVKAKTKGRAPSSPYDEDRLLEQNRRMQRLNNAPAEFPGFVRDGFQVKVFTNNKYVTSKSGLMYYDMVVGQGEVPHDGQQVIFHYTGYNESGRRVDSSYQQGRPARTRVGIQGMIPGFEEGIKSMRAGGRRIIIVPPELGPPVGPSTFFSAKQFEVFDVELLETKDCNRRTLLFYSDVVCD